MATNANIQLGWKDSTWFTANATRVLKAGQVVFLSGTRTFKVGDGTTQLSALVFYDASGASGSATWGSITGTLSNQTDLQTALNGKVPTTRTVNNIPLTDNVEIQAADVFILGGSFGGQYVQDALENLATNKQPSDADLTTIAGLSPSDDDIIQRKAGAWTNRTIVQYKADLALNNVDNTSDATKNSAIATLTNKTIALADNTVTGTTTQFNSALTGDDFVFASDARLTDARAPRIVAKNFTPASGTNTTSEELLHSLPVAAGVVAAGDLLDVFASVAVNSSAGTKIFRMYINTSASLIGATLIATSATFSTNSTSIGFTRFFPVISDTSLECMQGATGAVNTWANASTGTAVAITVPSLSAGFYIIFSGTKSSGADTDTVRASWVRNSKS